MTRNRLLLWALIALALWQGWQHWLHRPVKQPDGVLEAGLPVQTATALQPFRRGDLQLTPRAHYALQGRFLSRTNYHFSRYARLAPVDYAIGWGRMSDNVNLEPLDFRHGNRFFLLSWQVAPPIPEGELFQSISNNHVIPATPQVRKALDRMRPGQVVRLEGELVDVDAPDGWYLRTSLVRTDNGDGACEVFFVTRAEIVLHGR